MEEPTYYEQVYAVVRQIPKGKVTSYGAVADFLALGSARMVGWALHQSQLGDRIPAHRVLNRLGELSGRHAFPYPEYMQELLEQEGLNIKNHRVVDLKIHFWHPAEMLQETPVSEKNHPMHK